MSFNSKLPERPRILVVTLRRLGDVLLTTPLLRTLRKGFPNATLDTLVFRGSDGILKGNPDIDDVLTIAERPSAKETLAMIAKLWRRYDLVVSTQAGDRPRFLRWSPGAARRSGLARGGGAWWKRHVYHRAVVAEPDCHRVEELFHLADALGLARQLDIVCPQGRRWMQWRRKALMPCCMPVRCIAISDGTMPAGAMRAGSQSVGLQWWRRKPRSGRARLCRFCGESSEVIRNRGQLDWPGLAALLKGASVYVGPDTSVTHLAAGSGCPTVALFGPTDPRLWGPWPVGGLERPWAAAGSIQRRGNVWLVQNSLPCTPCQKEGCDRHLTSHSQCLDELTANPVLAAVDQAIAWWRDWEGPRQHRAKIGMEGEASLPAVNP